MLLWNSSKRTNIRLGFEYITKGINVPLEVFHLPTDIFGRTVLFDYYRPFTEYNFCALTNSHRTKVNIFVKSKLARKQLAHTYLKHAINVL